MKNAPRLLPRAGAQRGWWGGIDTGQTLDWTYVLDDDVCQIVFGLPVGGSYSNAGGTFDVYERDIVWRVLSGTLVATNPETGETHRVEAGEALVCGGDVWHDGHNWGDDLLTVVEFTAPAKTRASDVQPRSLPRLPATRDARAKTTARVARRDDMTWGFEGSCGRVLVGHVLATPAFTVAEIALRPGQQTGNLVDDGIKTLLVVDGHVAIQWPDDDAWFELYDRDGAYIPGGTPHRLVNLGASSAVILCQIVKVS